MDLYLFISVDLEVASLYCFVGRVEVGCFWIGHNLTRGSSSGSLDLVWRGFDVLVAERCIGLLSTVNFARPAE